MSAASGRGAHCLERGCHKLDFLPFTCDKCHSTFCLDHRDPSHHTCTFDLTAQRVMPVCPVCQQHVFVPADAISGPDGRVNAHILSGCKEYLMKDVLNVVKAKQSVTLRCDFVDGCSNRQSYATMQCKKCRLQYCLSHRFPEQHKCAALAASASSTAPDKHAKGKALMEKLKREKEEREAQKAAAGTKQSTPAVSSAASIKRPIPQRQAQTTTLQQIRAQMASVGSYIAESIVGTSNTEQHPASAAAAVSAKSSTLSPPPPPSASMRKSAVGDDRIAASDRWYWWLDASPVRRRSTALTAAPLLAVFVNKNWTVGRAVDSLCELAGVENDNHTALSTSAGRQRLCLGCERSLRGGGVLPFDLPLHLLTPAVMDGDTVQLLIKEVARTPSPQPAAAVHTGASDGGIEVVGMGLT